MGSTNVCPHRAVVLVPLVAMLARARNAFHCLHFSQAEEALPGYILGKCKYRYFRQRSIASRPNINVVGTEPRCRRETPAGLTRPGGFWWTSSMVTEWSTLSNTAPRRPVVRILDQAPGLDFLRDCLGVDASDGNIHCDGEWKAACVFQTYGCRHIVSINAEHEEPIRGGCGLHASSCANLSLLGRFFEWARDIILTLRSHLKAEFKRVENDLVSTRLRDAHIELYLMLVRALLPLPLDIFLLLLVFLPVCLLTTNNNNSCADGIGPSQVGICSARAHAM